MLSVGTCLPIMQCLPPTNNKPVSQSKLPFRSNHDSEPFILCNTNVFHTNVAFFCVAKPAMVHAHINQGLGVGLPGRETNSTAYCMILTTWLHLSTTPPPKLDVNNNHHVFIFYHYFLGTLLIFDMYCHNLILTKHPIIIPVLQIGNWSF